MDILAFALWAFAAPPVAAVLCGMVWGFFSPDLPDDSDIIEGAL